MLGSRERSPGPGPVPFEVFRAFLVLGLTSFGGPIAHLGYFRREFVERRRWLDEPAYADLVALCQFLPGPASSQVGFAIGLRRAGWRGGLAAWIGFTIPSALLLVLVAMGIARAGGEGGAFVAPVVHALKVVAVAVVAQAVWSMSRTLTPDAPRRSVAVLAAMLALAWPGVTAQAGALAASALIGWTFLGADAIVPPQPARVPVGRRAAACALAIFAAILAGLPMAAGLLGSHRLQVLDAFYRAGALVFGGGHVVLPLLEAGVVAPGWVAESSFLAGYGAAQAVPGPLFTFAAYLGYVIGAPAGPLAGWGVALACLVAVFLPGLLILAAALPYWARLRQHAALQSAVAGVNAGVVGILLAALVDPVASGAIHSLGDAAIAAVLLALLAGLRWPPLAVVAAGVAAGVLRALIAT